MGQFSEGYTYVFTDKDKALGYHNRTLATDLTVIKVGTASHGSQTNPYVIASLADWETFVRVVSNDSNHGAGKFFALAANLDFSGITDFHAVPLFSGTFYGLGYTLSNITSSTWKKYDNSAVIDASQSWGYGLFCKLTNATITDLSVNNFLYKDMPHGIETHENRGGGVGGIAGYSSGNDYILNCHTNGSISSDIVYTDYCTPAGGLVGGGFKGTTAENLTFFYRSSANLSVALKFNSSDRIAALVGGIIGDTWYCKNSTYIYDCTASITRPHTDGNIYLYTSGADAILGRGSNLYIDGFVGKIDATTDARVDSGSVMGLFTQSGYHSVLSVKNYYVDAIVRTSSGMRSMHPYMDNNSFVNTSWISVTSSNVNYTNTYAFASERDPVTSYAGLVTHSSATNLLAAAKNAVGASSALNSAIWNSSKIGGYAPNNSPVRNYLTGNPENVELEYTGEQLTVMDTDWGVEAIYGNNDFITASYPTSGITSVGMYSVILNLVGSDGRTWSDYTTTPKTVTFTVKPKKLNITWDQSGGIPVAKITSGLADADSGNPPQFMYVYTDMSDNSTSSTAPTKKGTYKVKATLANAGTGKNYELQGTTELTFQLTEIPVATPTVAGDKSKVYTGEPIEFVLANDHISEGLVLPITQADMPKGLTYSEETASDGSTIRKISATDVGTYYVQFQLADTTNNTWDSGLGMLTLQIKERDLRLTINRDEGWIWDASTEVQFTISHDGAENDNIQYRVVYQKADGEEIIVGRDKMSRTGRVTTVTLDPMNRGTYQLTVELDGNASDSKNGNYNLTAPVTQSITVRGKQVSFDASSLVWRYTDGSGNQTLTDGTEITYTGGEIRVSVDESTFASQGVRVESYTNEAGTDVNNYTTTVKLTRYNDNFEYAGATFTINWKIIPAKYDLSTVKWNYTGPLQYTGANLSVSLLNLPATLEARYTRNTGTNPGTQKATVQFTTTNPRLRGIPIPISARSIGRWIGKSSRVR